MVSNLTKMSALYDKIGINYSELRRPDPRIEAAIHAALGDAETILNVGAGTDSYEPQGKEVTAVEPSAEMIRQRPPGSAPVIQANAEDLPFDENSFDAAMAILTLHHWSDVKKGLSEMRRVTTGTIVILTFDPKFSSFWLADYIPDLFELDQSQMPQIDDLANLLGPVAVRPVPIPHDCVDGCLCAYWRRPEAYLDPVTRSAISSFSKIRDIKRGLKKLEQDLNSGAWNHRNADLLKRDACDFGYRLVVTT